MKILAVCHDPTMYGAQRSLFELVSRLPKTQFSVSVCCPRVGAFTEACEKEGIPVFIVPHKWWIPTNSFYSNRYYWRYFFDLPSSLARIFTFLWQQHFDIIYTNTVTVVEYAIVARVLRKNHIWHLREGVAGNSQLQTILSPTIISKVVNFLSNRVVFNSNYLLRQYAGIDSKKAIVVYNGITIDQLNADSLVETTSIIKTDSVLRLITIGYMDHRKGLDILLDALMLLDAGELERIHLTVVGSLDESFYKSHIEPRLRNDKLISVVNCLGWSDDVLGKLQQNQILVSSSRDEAFGRTIVEAMLVGLAVVATRAGGPDEIVIDGQTGILVPIDDPGSLKNAIQRFLQEPDLIASMGNAGRVRAEQQFSATQYVQAMSEVFWAANANTTQ